MSVAAGGERGRGEVGGAGGSPCEAGETTFRQFEELGSEPDVTSPLSDNYPCTSGLAVTPPPNQFQSDPAAIG